MKKNTNIDAALRYFPVVRDIRRSKLTDQDILEVGSGTNGISDYVDNNIIGVDADFAKTKEVKNSNIKHIKGDILRLPFKDKSFNLVVCLDTFEHIPGESRQKAIEELMRVLKKGGRLYLSFPTGSLSRLSEELINAFFKLRHKKDHIWLIEHRQYGLPDSKKMQELIKGRVRVIHNVNLGLWLIMHWVITVFGGSRLSLKLQKVSVWLFISDLIKFGPYYRDILIAEK